MNMQPEQKQFGDVGVFYSVGRVGFSHTLTKAHYGLDSLTNFHFVGISFFFGGVGWGVGVGGE